jgi:hypothetical protein
LRQIDSTVGPLELLRHLLSFAAPALVVAVLVAGIARIVLPPAARPASWWMGVAINAIAGIVVLAAGLWVYGRDGKMMTYAALVVVVATVQWLCGRAWR